jgi:hypothetical protein
VLLNLAQSELRSGHEADAARHFSMYLREAKDATANERESAEAGLFAAKAVIGEIAVSAEEGATIYVDGAEEGLSPLPDALYLTPGPHRLEARKDGKVARAKVVAKAGEATEVTLRFTPPKAAGAGPTRDEVRGDAGSPPEEDHGTSGGRESFFSWVGHTPLAWVGGGLTIAGIAGGVGFGLSARQNYENADSVADQIRAAAAVDQTSTTGICSDPLGVLKNGSNVPPERLTHDANEYRNACKKHEENVSQGDTMKLLSIVSWGVAGAAAVGTVIYYLVDAEEEAPRSSRKASPPLRVGATVAPGHGFVTLQGDF